jgi:hypothetical protein
MGELRERERDGRRESGERGIGWREREEEEEEKKRRERKVVQEGRKMGSPNGPSTQIRFPA